MRLKSQDIVIIMKAIAIGDESWRMADIAYELGISTSEVSDGLERLRFASLIDQDKKKPLKKNLIEFLIHGLRYVFPVEAGSVERGVPTAHSANVLPEIVSQETYVWEHPAGEARGHSILPLYKTVPEAAMKDSKLHQLLALVESLRVGKARERVMAGERLESIFNNGFVND